MTIVISFIRAFKTLKDLCCVDYDIQKKGKEEANGVSLKRMTLDWSVRFGLIADRASANEQMSHLCINKCL